MAVTFPNGVASLVTSHNLNAQATASATNRPSKRLTYSAVPLTFHLELRNAHPIPLAQQPTQDLPLVISNHFGSYPKKTSRKKTFLFLSNIIYLNGCASRNDQRACTDPASRPDDEGQGAVQGGGWRGAGGDRDLRRRGRNGGAPGAHAQSSIKRKPKAHQQERLLYGVIPNGKGCGRARVSTKRVTQEKVGHCLTVSTD